MIRLFWMVQVFLHNSAGYSMLGYYNLERELSWYLAVGTHTCAICSLSDRYGTHFATCSCCSVDNIRGMQLLRALLS